MLKSLSIAAVALALAAGSATASPRSIDVWGAHVDVPTYLTDNDSREYEVVTGSTARGTAYMALDEAGAARGKVRDARTR
ncbi:hypothetical protein [uncultured Methylobacterium sp.]|uniref:hypothetical protein n=1 Tax=uncultured Methylobacterium sp. TaxID=157278 RepID=UPI0035CB97FF